jgi:tetratricopeptide (TPR) repeat protein
MIILSPRLHAESHVLVLQIQDANRQPLQGIEIGVMGTGGSDVSDRQGRARISLGSDTREGTAVSLQLILHGRASKYVFLSPFDGRVTVPSYRNEADNYAPIMLVKPGDRLLLSSNVAIVIWAKEIAQSLSVPGNQGRQVTVKTIAQHFSLPETDVERAIFTLAAHSRDSYQSAMGDMAQGNFDNAVQKLRSAVKERTELLNTETNLTFEATYELGLATYASGRFTESLEAMKSADKLKPGSIAAIEGVGLALGMLGQYDKSIKPLEAAFLGAIQVQGMDSVLAANYENNLASGLLRIGDFDSADKHIKHATEVIQAHYGIDQEETTHVLLTRAEFLSDEATRMDEVHMERVVNIGQDASSAPTLTAYVDLGVLSEKRMKQRAAEDIVVQVLNILLKDRESNDSGISNAQNALGVILLSEADFASASSCYKASLTSHTTSSPRRSPNTASSLAELAVAQMYIGQIDSAQVSLEAARHFLLATGSERTLAFAHLLHANGLLLASLGKQDEAVRSTKEALDLQVELLGESNPENAPLRKAIEFFGDPGFKPSMALNHPPLAVLQHKFDVSEFCPVN